MIRLVHADSTHYSCSADLILTDPPFDMPAQQLLKTLENYSADHLVLITTMKQLADIFRLSDWDLSFDFVLDAVVPKHSKSIRYPNYTHQTGVYLKKPGSKSVFNRKRRQRSDTFDNNGFWPTILRAPRNRMSDHGMAKNLEAVTDILGSFEIQSVVDPFAGSGTTALAAWDLGFDCTAIEKDDLTFENLKQTLKFMSVEIKC